LSRNRTGSQRCPDCRMQRALCVCALLPSLTTRTKVVLLLHQLELRKTTNTGRLALRCLTNSALALRGQLVEDLTLPSHAAVVTPAWLTEAARPVLLFPGADAQPLEDFASKEGPPLTLVVPDGTWSQASRMRKRFPGLDQIPCVRLPDTLVSTYRLRHDLRPGHLSTMQAIAHAIGILESEEMEQQLLHALQVTVERTLYSKGRLPADQITGGLPGSSSPVS
jgi:DTW domain-containing protein YfiP